MCWRHAVVVLCICVCMCVYVCVCDSDFSKVAKNHALAKTVQAQHNNSSNLILKILNECFCHYLWCDLLTSNTVVARSRLQEDKSAPNRPPCSLKVRSIQQVQLLMGKLRSKQAFLATESSLWPATIFWHTVSLQSILPYPNPFGLEIKV